MRARGTKGHSGLRELGGMAEEMCASDFSHKQWFAQNRLWDTGGCSWMPGDGFSQAGYFLAAQTEAE